MTTTREVPEGVPEYDVWLPLAIDELKKYAAELGDGPFFAGESPGYGEAFVWHNLGSETALLLPPLIPAGAPQRSYRSPPRDAARWTAGGADITSQPTYPSQNIPNLDQCFFLAKPEIAEALGEVDMAKLEGFYERFAALDGIKEYLAKRPTQWGVPGSKANP